MFAHHGAHETEQEEGEREAFAHEALQFLQEAHASQREQMTRGVIPSEAEGSRYERSGFSFFGVIAILGSCSGASYSGSTGLSKSSSVGSIPTAPASFKKLES